MTLMDFDDELKDAIEHDKKKELERYSKRLKEDGMNDYQIEREMEQLTETPDKLTYIPPSQTSNLHDVKFYFTDEEYKLFVEHFKVLSYQENNANANWLLLGFLKLVNEGRVAYSEKSKEVWVI